ncbi:MAG: omptin family outer membrane protease [Treponema sp.]|jgi:outer membrane protease|nr:omptin family outer membrane protease [Treponema sp.]
MKNIAVFVFFVTILAAPAAVFSGPGFLAGHALSLGLETGLLYGYGEESVYAPDGNRQSRLTWDLRPLFYAGAALDVSRIDPLERAGFVLSLSLKFGIPAGTGAMEDRDWDWDYQGLFTGFSRHENYTEGACLFDGLVGVSLPFRSRMAVTLYGVFSWVHFSWTGRNGYGQYLPAAGSGYDTTLPLRALPPEPFAGTVITYTQDWLFLAPGVSVFLPLASFFSLKLLFQGSPFLYCAAGDNHITTKAEYRDTILWGVFLEPGAGLSFMPRGNWTVSLAVSYRMIHGGRGTTRARPTGFRQDTPFTALDGQSGAALYVLNAGLSFKVRLQ